jgi:hypothetical protein
MRPTSHWLVPAGLGGLLVLAVALPYLAAPLRAPAGSTFTGFLINPLDGFSYLAKMRQGWDGAWFSQLPYSPVPTRPAAFFVFHLWLGHAARWSELSLLAVFHAARLAGALAMAFAVYRLVWVALPPEAGKWQTVGLILFGSGWGWLGTAFGVVGADLNQPEATPFLSAFASAHFPVAVAGMAWWTATILRPPRGLPASVGLSAALSLGLVLLAPYALVILVAGTLLWLVWDRLAPARDDPTMPRTAIWAVSLAILAAWGVYYLTTVSGDPGWASWHGQNQTPSPSPSAYLVAFLPLLIPAAAGLTSSAGLRTLRPLVAWVVVVAAALYAPVSLQRRFLLGVFVPLGILAWLGLGRWFSSLRARNLALVALLVMTFPSHLLVVAAGISGVGREQPGLTISDSNLAGYGWLAQNAPRGALVLAGPNTGNQIPAFASVRVLYGHPFESPGAEAAARHLQDIYAGRAGLPSVDGAGSTDLLVFYGREERSLGSPPWLDDLATVFEQGDTRILLQPSQP